MSEPNSSDKWKYTLYTTFVLLLLFNPVAFKAVNSILGGLIGPISSNDGYPTTEGFLVHVLIFTLVIRYMMDIKI
jgi:hypothetical protein